MDKPCFFQDEEYPCRCYDETETCVYGFYEECNYGKHSCALETYNQAKLAKAREISKEIQRWLDNVCGFKFNFPQTKANLTKIIKKYL